MRKPSSSPRCRKARRLATVGEERQVQLGEGRGRLAASSTTAVKSRRTLPRSGQPGHRSRPPTGQSSAARRMPREATKKLRSIARTQWFVANEHTISLTCHRLLVLTTPTSSDTRGPTLHNGRRGRHTVTIVLRVCSFYTMLLPDLNANTHTLDYYKL